MSELTAEQKVIVDGIVHRIMPILMGYANVVGMKTVANALVGIACGYYLETGMDAHSLMKCVAKELGYKVTETTKVAQEEVVS